MDYSILQLQKLVETHEFRLRATSTSLSWIIGELILVIHKALNSFEFKRIEPILQRFRGQSSLWIRLLRNSIQVLPTVVY